jgi:hypothetical protein
LAALDQDAHRDRLTSAAQHLGVNDDPKARDLADARVQLIICLDRLVRAQEHVTVEHDATASAVRRLDLRAPRLP